VFEFHENGEVISAEWIEAFHTPTSRKLAVIARSFTVLENYFLIKIAEVAH
jgi:hypothetical protein